jgi:hypothetical protein
MGVRGQLHVTLPTVKTRYPFYTRLGGIQSRSGQVRKISLPPGFDPRTLHPIGSRYTDWAIPANNFMIIDLKMCCINPISTQLNPICHFVALLGAQHILHVSRIRANNDYLIVMDLKVFTFRAVRSCSVSCQRAAPCDPQLKGLKYFWIIYLNYIPWKCRQYVSPKHLYSSKYCVTKIFTADPGGRAV